MVCFGMRPGSIRLPLATLLLLGALLSLSACQRPQQPNSAVAEQAGLGPDNTGGLQALNVSKPEMGELAKARQAGLSDQGSIDLIKLARSRHKPFTGGQAVADLLSVGSSEKTVLELARLGQLGLWTGQAQALRLAGFSDSVILAVAQRRSQGLPVLSGEKLASLKNAGASETQIIDMIQKGSTEQQASAYIAQRERAAGGHSFVYQGRRRRRR
jgi:hypothetical protein